MTGKEPSVWHKIYPTEAKLLKEDLCKDILREAIQNLEKENGYLRRENEKLRCIMSQQNAQSIMTDRLTDKSFLEDIINSSGVEFFNDDVRYIIDDVINDLLISNRDLLLKLRLNHIDRAVFKYKQAKEKKPIHNTKQYFKACIISALHETGLDEL